MSEALGTQTFDLQFLQITFSPTFKILQQIYQWEKKKEGKKTFFYFDFDKALLD